MDDTWKQLHTNRAATQDRRIQDMLDDKRVQDFTIDADGLYFDYSKTNIDADAKVLLLDLAGAADWQGRAKAMFSGEKINTTEDRAVLHTALRRPHGKVMVDGQDVMPGVLNSRARVLAYAEEVRRSNITDVVNIGIGGSDLGPLMATIALAPYNDGGPRLHFVSNVDGAHIHDILKGLNPATTLILVASKTFTTIETMTNAHTAKSWGADKGATFAALSSNQEHTAAFGIPTQRVFGFEDWVGGRYSMWGPIGLPIAIAIGAAAFENMLSGAYAMDQHFLTAPAGANMPVMLALVGLWHHQVCGYPTRAVLPYEQRLLRLPAYLQQLEMESNGKRVGQDGLALTRASGPVVWGEPGTNGQHAFYQLIHQGTGVVPCEFMVAQKGHEPGLAHHHRLLQANCLAQAQALMLGRDMDAAMDVSANLGYTGAEQERQAAHRVFEGNRPSSMLLYPKLTPYVLGQIIALYEHRVFVEGVILGINSFDQWGVELGKELAKAMEPALESGDITGLDPSTLGLVRHLANLGAADETDIDK